MRLARKSIDRWKGAKEKSKDKMEGKENKQQEESWGKIEEVFDKKEE